jgi:hypothetical protein
MSESILTSVKKNLGIIEDDTSFDSDIILDINGIFPLLYQIGVGPEGFQIEDSSATWEDYLGSQVNILSLVKLYMYLQVKMIFDPPLSASVISSYENRINEYTWRINCMVDPNKDEIAAMNLPPLWEGGNNE